MSTKAEIQLQHQLAGKLWTMCSSNVLIRGFVDKEEELQLLRIQLEVLKDLIDKEGTILMLSLRSTHHRNTSATQHMPTLFVGLKQQYKDLPEDHPTNNQGIAHTRTNNSHPTPAATCTHTYLHTRLCLHVYTPTRLHLHTYVCANNAM